MRITCQLINAQSGAHVWADRFDKTVSDIFDLQDEIVTRVASALDAQFVAVEARRGELAQHPDAMDLYFQGLAWIYRGIAPENYTQAQHFFERGIPVAERCERAPATFAAVSRLPQPAVALRSPCAMYSVLQPHTHIPPHTGVGNFRLVVHLPLILPSGCRFRVGHTTRPWRVGEAWVFDDTIEHEAWNDSDEPRTILICDIWSPYLSPDERAVIAQVIAATDAYSGMPPTSQI